MAKKTKRRASSSNYRHSHHHEHQSALIIIAGGFLVILLGLIYFTTNPFTVASVGKTMRNDVKQMTRQQKKEAKRQERKENRVVIKDYTFSPNTLTVKVGETVRFVNRDSVTHSAVADDGSFRTKALAPGDKDDIVFSKAGTYTFHCEPHANMKGTIVVTE